MEEPASTVRAQSNFTIVPNNVIASAISDRAFRVYVAIRSYVREGYSTFPKASTVSERYNINERTFFRGVKELIESGLLVVNKRTYGNGFVRVNEYFFPDCQFESDKSVIREADKSVGSRYVQSVIREEEKVEEEKVEEENLLAGLGGEDALGSKRVGSPRAKSAPSLLPADFLSDDLVKWAGENTPGVDVQTELMKFKVYWEGKKKADWPRTWKNWMLRAKEWQTKPPQKATPQPKQPWF